MSSRSHRKCFVLGLTGGIASGKSTVAQVLEELGAEVIRADQIGHEVLRRPLVVRRLLQVFGAKIADAAGGIDRRRLGALVFEGSEAALRRKELEAVVHPLIHAEGVQQLRQIQQWDVPPPAVVVDAPLLLEAGWAPMCDLILFVDTPLELRQLRAEQRGWTREQLLRREAAQLPLDEKRRQATHVLDGGLPREALRARLKQLLGELRG